MRKSHVETTGVCERQQAEGTGAWLEAVAVEAAVGAQYSTSRLRAAAPRPTNQTLKDTRVTLHEEQAQKGCGITKVSDRQLLVYLYV